MVTAAMPDEYYERYRRLSHEQLFRELMAGSPAQVERVAGAWRAAGEAVGALAAELRADLTRLASTWSGLGSQEYTYRLGLVVAYAQKLAEEATAMRTGLGVMSGALTETQRLAEPDRPEPPVDATVAAFGGFAALGRTMAADEKAKAHERVAVLVARLAAEYGVADHRSWPTTMPVEPADLPAGAGSVAP